ncbi:MAG: DUF1476 domain-containing protein [Holosporaceae bacterium]|jgi:hypothetical protein|nr:DUF1476 domain-containing protein [Holosporaceae bacterium]
MPMFSLGKSSCETKLLDLLQSKFFATARRNKILAKWAGGRLGHKDGALSRYVRRVIVSYLITPNDRNLVARIRSDFQKASINVSEEVICEKIKAIEKRIRTKRGNRVTG